MRGAIALATLRCWPQSFLPHPSSATWLPSVALAHPRNRHGKLLAVVVAHGGNKLNGAAAITYDGGTKIQRHYGGYSADNGGSALQCVIGNLRGEKFFVSLGDVNGISVRERHENISSQLHQISTTAS